MDTIHKYVVQKRHAESQINPTPVDRWDYHDSFAKIEDALNYCTECNRAWRSQGWEFQVRYT
jgi:hypothetical protein